LVACSATVRPDLFEAALAGQGQCAIIVRATLRLIPAPPNARVYSLTYPDLTTLMRDLRRLIRVGRFDTVQGLIVPAPTAGWVYGLEAASYAPAPDDDRLLAGLGFIPGTEHAETRTYAEWTNRLAAQIEFLKAQGLWTRPHPWLDLFVPGEAAERFVSEALAALTPEDLGPFSPVLLFPLPAARFTRPLLRTAPGETMFLFDILRTAPEGEGTVRRLLAANRELFERDRALGGTHYPVGAIPLSRQDWQRHYGPAWEALVRAKRRYDPDGVLASGPDVFPHSS
jgi:FAD/FMN-containing dehydrogenase